ncbi:hypothetical protein V6N13_112322 [Hibiscus sabdariffa]|uniref:Uncharacterized protein n=1 Tax=Hibiscus sabdariffa TaxID=183260 RepID=A0ABR2TMT8_9ROSI
MKTAYLADHHHRGDVNDPFLETDRRETAKQEAAANEGTSNQILNHQLRISSNIFKASSAIPWKLNAPSIAFKHFKSGLYSLRRSSHLASALLGQLNAPLRTKLSILYPIFDTLQPTI